MSAEQSRLKRWLWPAAVVLLILPAAIFAIAAFAGRNNPAENAKPGSAETSQRVPRVPTIVVQRKDLARTIEMPGTVEGFESVELYAKIGGYLHTISVDIGDTVKEGQTLATLYVPEMLRELDQKEAEIARATAAVEQTQAAIRQMEAEVTRAGAALEETAAEALEKKAQREYRQAEYRRIKGLVDSGAVSRKLLDEATYQLDAALAAERAAEARVRTAEATVGAARANLDKAKADAKTAQAEVAVANADQSRAETMMQYATIRSPFPGVVTKRWVDRGAFIQPAAGNSAARPLLAVTRTDVVRVFVDLPMAEVGALDRGDKAVLDRIAVFPDKRFPGEITRFASALDMTSRMMRVEIDLDNPDGKLMPGYYGYVTVFLEQYPRTPVVPSSALAKEGTAHFVSVVDANVCRRRAVTLNFYDGRIAGIATGLKGGEQVVRTGAGSLNDGEEVIPVLASADTSGG